MKNNFEENMVVEPIEFEDKSIRAGRNDVQENFWDVLRENESPKIILQDPDSVPVSGNFYMPQNGRYSQPLSLADQIRINAKISDDQDMVFQDAVSKAYAKTIEMVNHEKVRETTSRSDFLTERGFMHGTKFTDGTQSCYVIANARIIDAKKWKREGNEFFRLRIQNLQNNLSQWTPIIEMSELEEEKYVENFMSRYFSPVESRAYSKNAIKALRSGIYDVLNHCPEENIEERAGWKASEHYVYVDGEVYPLQNAPLAILRKPRCESEYNINYVLKEICDELVKTDFQDRICCLIDVGMTSWLSALCIKSNIKQLGLLLTGEAAVCRDYAESCLKVYSRELGSDILDLVDLREEWLAEYVKILRDDVIVLDCFETAKKMKLLKLIVAGGTIMNCKMEVPLAILQRFPDEEITYTDFISIDLLGFKRSNRLNDSLKKLKSILLQTIEMKKRVEFPTSEKDIFEYADTVKIVLNFLKQLLLEAGAECYLVEQFIEKLELGTPYFNACQQLDSRNILLHIFKQRFQKLIDQGDIWLISDDQLVSKEDCAWIKSGSLFIPSKYFNYHVLPLMGLQQKEFKRIREILIAKGFMRIYNSEAEFTKKISLSSGQRVHVYDFDVAILSK